MPGPAATPPDVPAGDTPAASPSAAPAPSAQIPDAPQRLKVGFFAFDGYHTLGADGEKSGYGYDYLQHLARHGDWVYDYAGYDKSWAEMQAMLEAGEIDLLTSVQKPAGRDKMPGLSALPMGVSHTLLTTWAGNPRFAAGATFAGLRVGMLRGSARNADFMAYAAGKGFAWTPLFFASLSEMRQALHQGGPIDAMLAGSLRLLPGEQILLRLVPRPFYLAVRPGAENLLRRVNLAMTQLQRTEPELEARLARRYFAPHAAPALNEAERACVERLIRAGRPLRVAVKTGVWPLAGLVDGVPDGLVPGLAALLRTRTGLPLELVCADSDGDYARLLADERTALLLAADRTFTGAEKIGCKLTDPYLHLAVSRLSVKGQAATRRVAALRDFGSIHRYLRQTCPAEALVLCDSVEACVQTLRAGRAQAAYLPTWAAEAALAGADSPAGEKQPPLVAVLVSDCTVPLRAAVRANQPHELLGVLDKALSSLGAGEIARLVTVRAEPDTPPVQSLKERLLLRLENDPVAALAAVGAFLACALLLVLIVSHSRTRRLLESLRESHTGPAAGVPTPGTLPAESMDTVPTGANTPSPDPAHGGSDGKLPD